MTLAEIIRAQLATGRPLRVTRALLEALGVAEAGCRVTDSYTVDLGRERDEARRNASAWADERDVMRRERDEWRALAAGHLRERDEASAEVERLREQDARLEAALRGALETAIGRASPETMAREIREAEERGARWALVAVAMWSGGAWAASVAEARAERICTEAREAGEHE